MSIKKTKDALAKLNVQMMHYLGIPIENCIKCVITLLPDSPAIVEATYIVIGDDGRQLITGDTVAERVETYLVEPRE